MKYQDGKSNSLKRNQYILFVVFIITLGLVGCDSPVAGTDFVPDIGTEIYVESLLTNSEHPSIIVKSAESAYTDRIPKILTDEKVEVSIGISDGGNIPLNYDFENKVFTTDEFSINSGEEYRLNVDYIDNPEIKSAFSKTSVPLKENFSNLEFLKNYNAELTVGFFHYSYDVAVTLRDQISGNFFLIEPVSRAVIKEGDTRNYNREYNPYTIDDLYNPFKGVRILNDASSLLVDFTNESERTLSFRISLDGNAIGFNPNRIQEHVYFNLWSISEDYYKYLKSGGGSPSQLGTIIEPIIEYSNIDNGRGIFGGGSMIIDSIAIQ